MITHNFNKYAEYYDSYYHDKDYELECDFLKKLLQEYSTQPVRTILDLGCGTGGHCIPLSCRGYDLVGVDKSDEMLKQARKKAKLRDCKARFKQNDIRKLRLNQTFDAVIVLFNVVGYLIENRDVHQMLETATVHLKSGGVFIFDFWFGPSVLADQPHERLKEVQRGEVQIIRFARPSLRLNANRVDIDYRVLAIREGQVTADIRENHQVRFFFLPELMQFLTDHDMKVLHFCKWMKQDTPPDSDWNACVVAGKS